MAITLPHHSGPQSTLRARTLPISGFGGGTLIFTSDGPVPIEWLRPGDMVRALDGSDHPVRWIGRDCLRHGSDTILAAGLSAKDTAHQTVLAARHRVVVTGWEVELNFGIDAALAEAAHVTSDVAKFPAPKGGVTSCSLILLDAPEVIQADGYWVETLQLTDAMFDCLTEPAREAVRRTQPDAGKHTRPDLPCLQQWEALDLRLDLEAAVMRGR